MTTRISNVATRLCGCSFIHPRQTLKEGLGLARRLGFSRVDVGFGGGNAHYSARDVALDSQRYADEVNREVDALNLVVNECFALNFGEVVNTSDAQMRKQTRELFRGLCDFAKRADFRSVMLIAGPIHVEVGAEYSRELAAGAMRELSEIAGEHDLLLNLEADCESCVSTPEAAHELCERVPGLGLTLDHSHFISQGIAPERVEMLYPFTRHLHIRQSAPGRIVAPVDEGVVDFADVLQKLNACGYGGLYCIEYLSLAPDDVTRRATEENTVAMRSVINAL